YSSTAECKKKARKVINKDFTDDQVNVIQNHVYSIINGRFHRQTNPFQSGDPELPGLALIETDLVAAELIKYYGDEMTMPIADLMKKYSMENILFIMADTEGK